MNIFFYTHCVNSTQDYIKSIKQLHLDYQNHIFILKSGCQTKSRGQHHKNWQSFFGNFHASFLIEKELIQLDLLSIRLGIALILILKEFFNSKDLSLKWVNDLLFCGKKCGGLLIEETVINNKIFLIVGIGINLKHHPNNLDFSISLAGLDVFQTKTLELTLIDEATKEILNINFVKCKVQNDWLKIAKPYFYSWQALIKNHDIKEIIGIGDMGELIVKKHNNEIIAIFSAISVANDQDS